MCPPSTKISVSMSRAALLRATEFRPDMVMLSQCLDIELMVLLQVLGVPSISSQGLCLDIIFTMSEISTRTHSSSNGTVAYLFKTTGSFIEHNTRALGHEIETCLYARENFLLLTLQKGAYKEYATVSHSINYL